MVKRILKLNTDRTLPPDSSARRTEWKPLYFILAEQENKRAQFVHDLCQPLSRLGTNKFSQSHTFDSLTRWQTIPAQKKATAHSMVATLSRPWSSYLRSRLDSLSFMGSCHSSEHSETSSSWLLSSGGFTAVVVFCYKISNHIQMSQYISELELDWWNGTFQTFKVDLLQNPSVSIPSLNRIFNASSIWEGIKTKYKFPDLKRTFESHRSSANLCIPQDPGPAHGHEPVRVQHGCVGHGDVPHRGAPHPHLQLHRALVPRASALHHPPRLSGQQPEQTSFLGINLWPFLLLLLSSVL